MHTSRGSFCLDGKLCVRCCGNDAGQQNLSNRHPRESGSTLVLVTMFMVGLFGFAALTIDVGRVYKEKRHEQFATDAAAYAGAAMLTNSPDAAIQEAVYLAAANGVASNEIQNAGTVEVGHWDTSALTFTAGGATPYNAVRVPAKRNVDMTFAKVVGMSSMSPVVHSIAALGSAGRIAGPIIPFAVTADQLATNTFTGQPSVIGGYMTLNSASVGSGKQGKIDLGVDESTGSYQNVGAWQADMTASGCNCTASVGSIPTISGNAQVQSAFSKLGLGSVFVVPVVENATFSGNSSSATIVGFVRVQLTNYQNTGSSWSATVMFLASAGGDQIGGDCPYQPCAQARALVQ